MTGDSGRSLDGLFHSVTSEAELRYGVNILPAGRRRDTLSLVKGDAAHRSGRLPIARSTRLRSVLALPGVPGASTVPLVCRSSTTTTMCARVASQGLMRCVSLDHTRFRVRRHFIGWPAIRRRRRLEPFPLRLSP